MKLKDYAVSKKVWPWISMAAAVADMLLAVYVLEHPGYEFLGGILLGAAGLTLFILLTGVGSDD